MGVIVVDPDDGHEEYGQDQEEQDSPQREDTKDDAIAVRHMTRDLVSHKKSSYKYIRNKVLDGHMGLPHRQPPSGPWSHQQPDHMGP